MRWGGHGGTALAARCRSTTWHTQLSTLHGRVSAGSCSHTQHTQYHSTNCKTRARTPHTLTQACVEEWIRTKRPACCPLCRKRTKGPRLLTGLECELDAADAEAAGSHLRQREAELSALQVGVSPVCCQCALWLLHTLEALAR